MPWSDLSDAVLNPDLATVLTVLRRTDPVGPDGRTAPQVVGTFSVVAVVTPASPAQLERIEDYQIGQKAIQFVTRFRVQLPSPGFQADWVRWPASGPNSDTYVVVMQQDASQFGAGFVSVTAISVDTQPQPPGAMPPGVNTGSFS